MWYKKNIMLYIFHSLPLPHGKGIEWTIDYSQYSIHIVITFC